KAGLLLAPQGIGAMVTMPIAGALADKIGPGKVVMTGIVVCTLGMGMFATLDENTGYPFLLAALFIMGLGMGSTMMPIMSAALRTLKHQDIARGSTLMNIIQQVAASAGTALFSVLFTNAMKSNATTSQVAVGEDEGKVAAALEKFDLTPDDIPATMQSLPVDLADAFSNGFLVATVLTACVLVPAFLLPRTKAEGNADQPPVVMH